MAYVLVPAALLVVAALVWTWWSGRIRRDPVSSIDSFHRALDAMQPPEGSEPVAAKGEQERDPPWR